MDWMRISNPSKDPILISLNMEGLEGIQIKHDKKMAIFFSSNQTLPKRVSFTRVVTLIAM